jgi:hypothetical protein
LDWIKIKIAAGKFCFFRMSLKGTWFTKIPYGLQIKKKSRLFGGIFVFRQFKMRQERP